MTTIRTRSWWGLGIVIVVGLLLVLLGVVTERPPAEMTPPVVVESGACARYASPYGSDDAAGSATAPLRTADALVRALQPGETGCLRAGEYQGDVTFRRDRTGLRSLPGERARLRLRTLLVPDGVEDVSVTDLDIVGSRGGLTVRLIGDRFLLARNDITNRHRGQSCVLIGGDDITSRGGRVIGNVIHHCGEIGSNLDHGVYAQNFGPDAFGGPGLLLEGNAFYEIGAYAIQLYPQGVGAVVRRNVIDGGGRSVRGGIVIDGELAQDALIEENIIANTRTGAVVQRTGSGHVARGNCFWDNPVDVKGPAIRSQDNTGSREGRRRCPLSLPVSLVPGLS